MAFSSCTEGEILCSCGEVASHCNAIFCFVTENRLQVNCRHKASVVATHGVCSFGSQALEHGLSSCGGWA